MKWIVVCTLQRGVLDPPEPLTEEENLVVDQNIWAQDEASKQPQPWWERSDFKINKGAV
jgi:hypothetical protein